MPRESNKAPSDPILLDIPVDKIGFIVTKAHAFDVKEGESDPDFRIESHG